MPGDNDRAEKKRMGMMFLVFAYAGYPRSLFLLLRITMIPFFFELYPFT
jgi:hypothetical protein